MRNKKKSHWKLWVVGVGIIGGIAVASAQSASVTTSCVASSTPTVTKAPSLDDVVSKKLENTGKFVTLLVKDKEELNKAKAEYTRLMDKYTKDLDAADLYGGGAIEMYSDIAKDRGLFEEEEKPVAVVTKK